MLKLQYFGHLMEELPQDPEAGKDWRQKGKGAAEDEMVRQHHWLNGHEFDQIPVVKDREAWRAAGHVVVELATT